MFLEGYPVPSCTNCRQSGSESWHVVRSCKQKYYARLREEEEEEEDEDIDALIEDLESQDGHGFEEEEEGDGSPAGAGRVIPEEMLQTDTRVGLTDSKS